MQKLVGLLLLEIFPFMTCLAAETHVVPIDELHRQAVSVTQTRQANLAAAHRFFSSAPVQNALRTVKMEDSQVLQAAALLSDEELARLAARTDKVQRDLAAGALSNQEITYIVIALATAVIVLIIVKAR